MLYVVNIANDDQEEPLIAPVYNFERRQRKPVEDDRVNDDDTDELGEGEQPLATPTLWNFKKD